MGKVKILFLAPDLADAAVKRRVTMLKAGGALVTVAGYRRVKKPIEIVAGCLAIDLGEVANARFIQRIIAIGRTLLRLGRYQGFFAEADLILARNLDMLFIGAMGRAFHGTRSQALIYECLDIHPLLLGKKPPGVILRWLERQLLRRCGAIVTSSPAFISNYLQKQIPSGLPIYLVENKVLALNDQMVKANGSRHPRPSGPPWVIGWFGMIRCQKSLGLLARLARESQGKVEVIIRGKPLEHLFGDFDKVVRELPHVKFLGPYQNPQDLEPIYREVHFNWVIDRFEAGLNSDWLLPNRIYEGGLYGAVPIALAGVEIGRLLKKFGIGVLLTDPLETALSKFFAGLTLAQYQALADTAQSLPVSNWVTTAREAQALVSGLESVSVLASAKS